MPTTVFRRGKAYTGQTKVDRGYTRPQVSLGSAVAGMVSQGSYGGNAPTLSPQGPALTGDTDTGKLWAYLDGQWVFTGITVSLS